MSWRISFLLWFKLSIFLGLQVILIAHASESQQPSLEKRGFPFGSSSTGQSNGGSSSSSKENPQGPPKDPSEPLPEQCKLKPLTPQTWATLQLDNYLQTYPGGANITLSVGALFLHPSNLTCQFIFFSLLNFNFSLLLRNMPPPKERLIFNVE